MTVYKQFLDLLIHLVWAFFCGGYICVPVVNEFVEFVKPLRQFKNPWDEFIYRFNLIRTSHVNSYRVPTKLKHFCNCYFL